MSAATPIPKLVALLAMVTAVALVSHEVSAVTANSSEINELMPARIATPSPVTATDANQMKQSLRTGKSSAAKASEERMGFFEAAGRAFSRTMKHAIPSNVLEEDVEALTHILDIIRLEEGVQASEADRKAVINLLQSQNLRGIEDLPDEDFSELVRLLSKTDWTSNVNSHDSFRTTKVSTAGTFHFDPKASLDSLASDIPLVRPALEDRKGKKFLVHQMVTEDGKLIPLSIPAEQEPL